MTSLIQNMFPEIKNYPEEKQLTQVQETVRSLDFSLPKLKGHFKGDKQFVYSSLLAHVIVVNNLPTSGLSEVVKEYVNKV